MQCNAQPAAPGSSPAFSVHQDIWGAGPVLSTTKKSPGSASTLPTRGRMWRSRCSSTSACTTCTCETTSARMPSRDSGMTYATTWLLPTGHSGFPRVYVDESMCVVGICTSFIQLDPIHVGAKSAPPPSKRSDRAQSRQPLHTA